MSPRAAMSRHSLPPTATLLAATARARGGPRGAAALAALRRGGVPLAALRVGVLQGLRAVQPSSASGLHVRAVGSRGVYRRRGPWNVFIMCC